MTPEPLETAERRFDAALADPTLSARDRDTAALAFFHRAYVDPTEALAAFVHWRRAEPPRGTR